MIQYKEVLTDNKVFNCLTSTLATLCKEQGMNFELMFLEDWRFSFETHKGNRLGGIINKNNTNYYHLLKKYCGIKVTEQTIDNLPTFETQFDENVAEGGFAIVYDTFYCPWVYNYQKEHQKHYSLALGFEQNGKFFCADTVPYSQRTELPISELFQSEVSMVSVKKCDEISNSYDYAEIIKNQAKTNLGKNGATQLLVEYANLIEKEFCVEKENLYCGTNSWVRAPFLVDIEWISRSRTSFHIAVKHLAELYDNNQFFKHVAQHFEIISNDWYTMFLSCWKMFLVPTYNNAEARKELSDSIRQLAIREEEVAKKIINYGGM